MGQLAFASATSSSNLACSNPGTCESRAFDFLDLGCLNKCKHMIVKLSNVNRVLPSLATHVARLDPGSVEHRTKKAQLDQLTAVQSKLQEQKGSTT